MAVQFLEKAPEYHPKGKRKLKNWIRETVEKENRRCGAITFVFEKEEEVYRMNVAYLDHDWYTDVISFDYSEGETVNGDVIISVERVRENSKKYGVSEEEEMRRVMIHGVLHLLGYEDDNEKKKKRMREKEDHYLSLWEKTG